MISRAREIVVDIAKSYLGKWYKWGGDDPSGFDCSGLVVECLISVGVLPRYTDWTAHQLWNISNFLRVKEENVRVGDLVFWSHEGRICHVEIVIDEGLKLSIGASGGGKKTTTVKDAIKQNAFIKIRPYRSGIATLAGFVNPYGD